MGQFQTRPKYFLVLSISLVLIGSAIFSIELEQNSTRLAGIAQYHLENHDNWKKIQSDPKRTDAEKIKDTINAYFILLYESWLDNTLYDTGYLFDKSNSIAYRIKLNPFSYILRKWRALRDHIRTFAVSLEGKKKLFALKAILNKEY